jgi:hypothetical protein
MTEIKRGAVMRFWQSILVSAAALLASCGQQAGMSGAQTAAVEEGVRAFSGSVAHDVTLDGPVAWRKFFSDSPAFFMAVDGHLQFPNSAAATAGIQNLTHSIKQIELKWGDDLRVDPLTPDLAMMAATYHEMITDPNGARIEAGGFFTGLAELRNGRWQFRNAHWSDPVAAAH